MSDTYYYICYALLIALIYVINVIDGDKQNQSKLNFLVVGNWGGNPVSPYSDDVLRKTAELMGAQSKLIDSNMVVTLGNNIMPSGASTINVEQFNFFEQVYNTDTFQNKPFYLIPGLLDYKGYIIQAEIDYSQQNNRWMFPNNFYQFKKRVSQDRTAEFIMIDTMSLGLNDNLPAGVNQPDLTGSDSRWDNVFNAIMNSQADYLFVVGHYPVFSACSQSNDFMIKKLQPVLFKYQANYIAGNTLCQEFIQESGVNYFSTGVASGGISEENQSKQFQESSQMYLRKQVDGQTDDKGGYAAFYLKNNYFYVEYLTGAGLVEYTTPHFKPRNLG